MEKYYKIISDNNVGLVVIEDGADIPTEAVEITETEFNEISKEIAIRLANISFYREEVNACKMNLLDVPEEYIDEVKSAVNKERVITNGYGVSDATYNNIIDDYTLSLIEGGVL